MKARHNPCHAFKCGRSPYSRKSSNRARSGLPHRRKEGGSDCPPSVRSLASTNRVRVCDRGPLSALSDVVANGPVRPFASCHDAASQLSKAAVCASRSIPTPVRSVLRTFCRSSISSKSARPAQSRHPAATYRAAVRSVRPDFRCDSKNRWRANSHNAGPSRL